MRSLRGGRPVMGAVFPCPCAHMAGNNEATQGGRDAVVQTVVQRLQVDEIRREHYLDEANANSPRAVQKGKQRGHVPQTVHFNGTACCTSWARAHPAYSSPCRLRDPSTGASQLHLQASGPYRRYQGPERCQNRLVCRLVAVCRLRKASRTLRSLRCRPGLCAVVTRFTTYTNISSLVCPTQLLPNYKSR